MCSLKMSNAINGELKSSSTFTMKWKVEDFVAYFKDEANDISSPELLTVYANNVSHWRLRLSKNYDREGYRSYMAVYLDYLDELPLTASVIFAILSSGRERVFQRVTKAKFDKNLNFCGIIDFVQQTLITDGSMNLLMDDSLIITCEIRFQDAVSCAKLEAKLGQLSISEKSSKKISDSNNNDKSITHKAITKASSTSHISSVMKNLSNDLEELLENESYSDVSFIVGERKIRAHKNILTSRSPIFQKMFAHHDGSIERKRSIVGVKDVRCDVMKELLRFVYAGKVNDIEKIAAELLVAAEKYALSELKQICEKTLGEKMKFENALDYLALAKNFNAALLHSKVMEFVVNRLGDYVNSPQFRDLSVDIKDDLLNAVSKKKIPR